MIYNKINKESPGTPNLTKLEMIFSGLMKKIKLIKTITVIL